MLEITKKMRVKDKIEQILSILIHSDDYLQHRETKILIFSISYQYLSSAGTLLYTSKKYAIVSVLECIILTTKISQRFNICQKSEWYRKKLGQHKKLQTSQIEMVFD